MYAFIGSTTMGNQGDPARGITVVALDGPHARVIGSTAPAAVNPMYLATSPPTVRTEVPTHVTGGTEPSYPSAIRISPDGRHCYVLNRGPNTIAVFTINGPNITLTATIDAGGDYPWDAILHDDHLYVVNQRTSTLTVCRIDPRTGGPHPTGTQVDVPHPVCILPISIASTHD